MKYTNLAVSPVDHCAAGQFGSVVTARHRQISAALSGQTVEFGHEVLAGDAAFDHSTQAFAGVLVMIETILTGRPSVVESNWKSTAHTRLGTSAITVSARSRCRGVFGADAAALAALLRAKALNLLLIDCPAFGAGVVIGGSKPPPRMILGTGAKPGPQRCIRILGRGRGWFVSLGGALLPGHAAAEPFADPQHALEVADGCRRRSGLRSVPSRSP